MLLKVLTCRLTAVFNVAKYVFILKQYFTGRIQHHKQWTASCLSPELCSIQFILMLYTLLSIQFAMKWKLVFDNDVKRQMCAINKL